MPTIVQPVIILSVSLMLLLTTAAVADDTLAIRLYNDGADDIVVTVYDMNAHPPGTVLASRRINGFAWIPISVTSGPVGKGHLTWLARTAGESFHRCGYQDRRGVANDDSVRVFADSRCVTIARRLDNSK